MQLDKHVITRIETLLSSGRTIVKDPIRIEMMAPTPKDEPASQWATSCQNILIHVFGESSVHYQRFAKLTCKRFTCDDMSRAIGVLAAAKDDYENGYLLSVRRRIEAEVFDNFLEQAQHLLDGGYFHPAAVLAGAVLEDGLRKLCDTHGISAAPKATMNAMNQDLAKAGAYNALTQKQLAAHIDLRNKAAHGRLNDFTKEDVSLMLAGIRNFMQGHLT